MAENRTLVKYQNMHLPVALVSFAKLRRHRQGAAILASYAAFILVGVSAGLSGVLIPAQMRDYGVDRATIGLTFFTFAAGFIIAGAFTGPLLGRLGIRAGLAVGGGATMLAWLAMAARPWFWLFVALQVVAGFGQGMAESALNVYLARLPNASRLLNRLHAFFGIGALIGPPLATWLLDMWPWNRIWFAMTLVSVPFMVAYQLFYPGRADEPQSVAVPEGSAVSAPERGGSLTKLLRSPAVVLASAFLAVYVGLEGSLGSWGFSFLVGERGQANRIAGYVVSGYWLGLTMGRFLFGPLADRLGLTDVAMSYGCLLGLAASTAFTWLLPASGAAIAGFALVGFFLGPLFPTTMAVVPRLTSAAQVPSAIGFLNGASLLGGAALPWVAGTLAQSIGMWTLLPFSLLMALGLLLLWWRMTSRFTGVRAG
jgi:fucose permease